MSPDMAILMAAHTTTHSRTAMQVMLANHGIELGPGISLVEFTLALHTASDEHAPGTIELGFGSEGIDAFYAAREANGVTFTEAPKDLHGMRVGKILDTDGSEMSVGGR